MSIRARSRARSGSLTAVGQARASADFVLLLQESGVIPQKAPSGVTATFTRATTSYAPDFEDVPGTKSKWTLLASGEVPIWGARRVRNLITYSEDITNAAWSTSNATKSSASLLLFTGVFGKITSNNAASTLGAGRMVAYRIKLSGSGTLRLRVQDDNSVNNAIIDVTLTSTPTVYSNSYTIASAVTFVNLVVDRNNGTATSVTMTECQIENISGQAITAPSEYVSTNVLAAPYHGFGIDGVKNFWTTNGNTVSSNVVTEAAGTPSVAKGYFPFAAATQLVTPTASIRGMTDASWVKVTMTNAKTSTGIDGVANTATRLTAAGANSTILQTLVAAASSRTYSVFLRRVTGTGTINITQDGGATWTDVTSQLNTSSYTRVQLTASVLNASFGIRIVTSGDAIDADFNQFEAGSVATPPIDTAGATRNADVDSYATTGMSVSAGTIYLEYTPKDATSTNRYLWGSYTDANNALQILHDGTNFTARKRLAAANNDAIKATALTAETKYKIAIRWGSTSGTDIFVNGVKGTNNANTSNAAIAATMQIGADGNSTNQADGGVANDYRWATALTDAVLLSMTT